MSIIAVFKNEQVEVIDTFEAGGIALASVRAIKGKPFVGGDKWPIHTEWATAKACELSEVHQDPQPEPAKPNLLSLALQHTSKRQWSAGESVWIWRNNGKGGAFLKEQNGFIHLRLVGRRASCVIFWLDPVTWAWETSNTINIEYQRFVELVKAEAVK